MKFTFLNKKEVHDLGYIWLDDCILFNIKLEKIKYNIKSIPEKYVEDNGEISSFKKGKEIKTPVELVLKDNSLFLYDGYHRFVQSIVNGDENIPALVEVKDSKEESIMKVIEIMNLKYNSEESTREDVWKVWSYGFQDDPFIEFESLKKKYE